MVHLILPIPFLLISLVAYNILLTSFDFFLFVRFVFPLVV